MNFAFALADPKQRPLAQLLAAWASWRHHGEIANPTAVAVGSLDAAWDVMLNALTKGSAVERVWFYSDGDAQGRVVGVLGGKGAAGALDPKAVSAFAQKSDKAKRLASFTQTTTEVSVFGAHATQAPDNFGAWREALGGGKGTVVIPDAYWQLALHHPTFSVVVPVTSKDCKAKAHAVAPKKRAELDAELAALDSAVDAEVTAKCLDAGRASSVKKELRANTATYFERLLRQWCALLDPGGEVPPVLRTKATSSQVLDVMWDLWDAAGGILYPFLGATRLGVARTEKLGDVDALLKEKGLAAVVPRDAVWPKHFVAKPARAAAGGKVDPALAAEQAKAEKLASGFQETFKSTFRFANNIGFKSMKAPVAVRVLGKADFNQQLAEEAQYLHDEDLHAFKKLRPFYVQDTLKGYYDKIGERFPDRLLTIDENTPLTREESVLIIGTKPPLRLNAAGFYSAAKKTLFIMQGELEPGVIAHEMCHAYADEGWNDFLLLMIANNLEPQITVLDEAVTSELADVAIYAQPSDSTSPTMSRPSGYVGYGPSVQQQGSRFLSEVEGGSTAKATTMEAYFGGLVEVNEDPKKKPIDWIVTLGSKKRKKALSSLLIP